MQNFFEEYIEGRVFVHDRYQFETKLSYNLDPSLKTNDYKVSMYMFIPKALDVNKHTYPKQQFFQDIRTFIRFQSPKISLKKLIEKDNVISPFNQLQQLIATTKDGEKIIHEMKLLAGIIKSNMKSEIFSMRSKGFTKEKHL